MHKQENRILKGASDVLNGCILDNPNTDPNDPVLHRVFHNGKNKNGQLGRIFILTKQVHDNALKDIIRNEPNDRHRVADQKMHFGVYIHFKYNQNEITDYEKGKDMDDTLFEDGKCLFSSACVFNDSLTQVKSDSFGVLDLERDSVMKLNKVPTPNITIKCYFEWKIEDDYLIPKLYKIIDINAEEQDFVSTADWNRERLAQNAIRNHSRYVFNEEPDDWIDLEADEEEQLGAITTTKHNENIKGFITGLTSIFVPSQFSETVLFPMHDRKFHSIGCEIINCSLVRNDTLNSYVVFKSNIQPSSRYFSLLSRTAEDVQGIFYITLDMNHFTNGFYKHPHFTLIADPYSHLDLVRFAVPRGGKRHYTVPIVDRLSKLHETRNLQDLGIITRFEVVSSGDDPEQIQMAESHRTNDKTKLATGGGIVLNAEENTVIARNFHGVTFKLKPDHGYSKGDLIIFEGATRLVDPDFLPTFQIEKHRLSRKTADYISFENGKFVLKAYFNSDLKCYEAWNFFGFIPCKKPPPEPTVEKLKSGETFRCIYKITAIENTQLPAQTVLFEGEYMEKLVNEEFEKKNNSSYYR